MSPLNLDETVNEYIRSFQRRYPAFDGDRRRDIGGIKQDALSRFFREYLALGDKVNFDAVLQGMLTDEEHARLETDPQFTKAWRIFVDLCWLKRQFRRTGFLVAGLLILAAAAFAVLVALPEAIGPHH